MHTVALFSSARPNGNTFTLLDTLGQYIDLEVIPLDKMNFAPYNYESSPNDDFIQVVEKMLKADNIIFASPVYWYAVTPTMKAFIDRITDLIEQPHLIAKGKALRSKNFYLAVTSHKAKIPDPFYQMFVHTLNYLGFNLKGAIHSDFSQTNVAEMMIAKAQQFSNRLRGEPLTVNHQLASDLNAMYIVK